MNNRASSFIQSADHVSYCSYVKANLLLGKMQHGHLRFEFTTSSRLRAKKCGQLSQSSRHVALASRSHMTWSSFIGPARKVNLGMKGATKLSNTTKFLENP